MRLPFRPLILSLMILFPGSAATARADDHIIRESKRTYMGSTRDLPKSEFWISARKAFIRDEATVVLIDFDKMKQFVLMPNKKRYVEEAYPSRTSQIRGPSQNSGSRISDFGFSYVPQFDWSVKETGETATINGTTCSRVVLTGEADYAQEVRELWIATESPVDATRFYSRIVAPFLDERKAELNRRFPVLTRGLVMKTTITIEPAIAPCTVMEENTTVEQAPPPAGIYEIPSGYTKASSVKEAYQGK